MQKRSIEERIRVVEDLWDSIAVDQAALRLTAEQRAEIDKRLDAYEADGNRGRPARDVLADIRRKL
jgi:putative addiction module component (TIGR02574 family)